MHVRISILLATFLCVIICECRLVDREKSTKHKHATRKNFKGNKRAEEDLLVQTKSGEVQGKENVTASGNKYLAFQGIPFAKPPVKQLRFEPPQPTQWDGTWNATYERSMCVQTDLAPTIGDRNIGNEDCLYINVYVPKLSGSKTQQNHAVLVWIHGGGFLTGDGNISYQNNPDKFLDENLIVVTLNYRLGVFGFLSTGDNVVPGNMGLKDQILALKWVKDNVKFFGGNPENVTIGGVSAGAVSVAYLVQSPLAKGLFKGAIMESGNTLFAWGLSRKARHNSRLLGLKFGVVGSSKQIVDRLKTENFRNLLTASQLTMDFFLVGDILNGFIYAPVVEPDGPTAVFSAKSFEQLSSCNLKTVPIIIGFNSEEVDSDNPLITFIRIYLLTYDMIPSGLVPYSMNASKRCNVSALGNQIKEHYVGRGGSLTLSQKGFGQFLSDDFFIRPTTEYVKLYSNCGADTYLYRFSYNPKSNTTGVGHGEELNYTFGTNLLKTRKDIQTSERVVKMWSNFVKTGDPTPEGSNLNVTWTPSSNSNDYSYLDIGYDLIEKNQETSPHKKDLDFWDDVYQRCGTRPYDTYKK